jgi:hypothetical protein
VTSFISGSGGVFQFIANFRENNLVHSRIAPVFKSNLATKRF